MKVLWNKENHHALASGFILKPGINEVPADKVTDECKGLIVEDKKQEEPKEEKPLPKAKK